MNCIRILDGTAEVITAQMETGLGDVVVNVRRRSNGNYLDWSDDTFKAAGWTTKNGAMAEIGSTGQYELTLDLSVITNLTADDQYVITVESPTSDYSPQIGEIKAGGFIDNIDAAVSSRSTHSAADVDTQLSSTHGTGSWKTGVLDLTTTPEEVAVTMDDKYDVEVTTEEYHVAITQE